MTFLKNIASKFYYERRNKIISRYYFALNDLNSITPSVFDLKKVKKALILAPHPDDEAIGCGGTLLHLAEQRCLLETIFYTHGEKENMSEIRRREALNSSKILGVKNNHFLKNKDFHLKPSLEDIDFTTSLLDKLKPDLVFVPFFLENHPDHSSASQIFASAAEKYSGEFLCFCYEVWSTLLPNYLIDITPFMDKKIEAIKTHESQCAECDFVDLVKGLNRYRAISSGHPFQYAEAFFVVSKSSYIKISKQF